MGEELGSTNITDLINEDDTDMNDDMVDKILHELENDVPEQNTINNNNYENEHEDNFQQDIHNYVSAPRNPTLDFRDPDFNNQNSVNFESENTVNKINSIINDSNGLELNSIIDDLKIPIIVFILSIVFNNPIIINLISNVLSSLIKNKDITNYISLILRTIIISIVLYLLKFFKLL
tara:strand:+ start:110 stop:640 length:531 start_codon:yes stop_codon:yes gene_type:complete